MDGLTRHDSEYQIVKKRFSPFFHTHLDLLLRRCISVLRSCIIVATHNTQPVQPRGLRCCTHVYGEASRQLLANLV